jgi:hypothetical protein
MQEMKGSARAIDMRFILSWREVRIWRWIRLTKPGSEKRIMQERL